MLYASRDPRTIELEEKTETGRCFDSGHSVHLAKGGHWYLLQSKLDWPSLVSEAHKVYKIVAQVAGQLGPVPGRLMNP